MSLTLVCTMYIPVEAKYSSPLLFPPSQLCAVVVFFAGKLQSLFGNPAVEIEQRHRAATTQGTALNQKGF